MRFKNLSGYNHLTRHFPEPLGSLKFTRIAYAFRDSQVFLVISRFDSFVVEFVASKRFELYSAALMESHHCDGVPMRSEQSRNSCLLTNYKLKTAYTVGRII